MIHRTYFVQMPSDAGNMPNLDILLRGPVGSESAPVRLTPAGGTAPPAGWGVFTNANSDGQFFEWRSRPIRFETEAGDTGFVPRARLGWSVVASPTDENDAGCLSTPIYILSQSLVGTLASPWDAVQIADPTYGPVLRLLNTPDLQGGIFVVNLILPEAKDEDRNPSNV